MHLMFIPVKSITKIENVFNEQVRKKQLRVINKYDDIKLFNC